MKKDFKKLLDQKKAQIESVEEVKKIDFKMDPKLIDEQLKESKKEKEKIKFVPSPRDNMD